MLTSSCPSIFSRHALYLQIKLMIKKMSFEVKHCELETVVLFRSAQAAMLKKTYLKQQDLRM